MLAWLARLCRRLHKSERRCSSANPFSIGPFKSSPVEGLVHRRGAVKFACDHCADGCGHSEAQLPLRNPTGVLTCGHLRAAAASVQVPTEARRASGKTQSWPLRNCHG